jgi:hypothetical protein
MSKFITKFETQAAYEAAQSSLIKPNVSLIAETHEMAYHPYVPPIIAITYTATKKLVETESIYSSGLHVNSFSGSTGQLAITNHTFENGVGTIQFNDSVTSIGENAFYSCSGMTSLVIPNSVISIGPDAFSFCSGLTSCTIGSGVTSIKGYVFRYCMNLSSITCNATTAPTISNVTFWSGVKENGTLYVPIGSSGYDVWMDTGDYYLGKYNWTKVEQ